MIPTIPLELARLTTNKLTLHSLTIYIRRKDRANLLRAKARQQILLRRLNTVSRVYTPGQRGINGINADRNGDSRAILTEFVTWWVCNLFGWFSFAPFLNSHSRGKDTDDTDDIL